MSATLQDPGAQEPEREREAGETGQQEQRERNLTRLDTILRTYAPRELELAREAIAAYPADKTSAVNAVWVALGDMRKVRDLVDAVAEADGAYEHATPAIPPCSTCGAPATHAARDMYTLYDPTSTVDRYQPGEMKTGCDAHPVESRTIEARSLEASIQTAAQQLAEAGRLSPEQIEEAAKALSRACAFEQPIIQEGMKLREDSPAAAAATRRVLGRGLAEIGEWTGAGRESGANFFLQAQNAPPMGPDEVIYIEGDPISKQRFEDAMAKGPDEVILSREEIRKILDIGTHGIDYAHVESKLATLTQRAIDEFLGTDPRQRTAALRGFLRFLTQEDLSTVLAECCVQIDDEHLQHTVRMLGPDDLQSLNFAAAGEVSTRMLDAGEPELPLRGFPLRPLEPHEHREPVDFSENGNPLLEKDVEKAIGYIEAYPRSTENEAYLATRLERLEGWNSVYAAEVAQEAWTRYYSEPELESKPASNPTPTASEDEK